MRLHRQMNRSADDSARDRHEFWVIKLLTMLSDKALRTAASASVDEPRTVVLECNFADQIWDDPRIERRVAALAQQGIQVERRDQTTIIAGESYTRRQLVLTF